MLDALTLNSDVTGAALAGLLATPKTLPPFLLYDAPGVALFEAITRLPEYYVTRTELALLGAIAPEIAALASPGSVLVEYGASDEGKALRLLDAAKGHFVAYMPIDVAGEALDALSGRLRRSRPKLRVHPLCGDFLRPIALPESVYGLNRFGFFPGSTIGNLDPAGARSFLQQAAATLRQDQVDRSHSACFIIGVDLRKAPEILVPAYDDSAGVTAAFNLNLLHRLNREAAADFDTDAFRHLAIWNEQESRIEMHLQSLREQIVRLAGATIRFADGETIHTENSYKHTIDGFQALAKSAGWTPTHVWTDPQQRFAIHALAAEG